MQGNTWSADIQDLIYMKPQPLLPLVLALVLFRQCPTDFKILQWKCPLQNENGLALSKIKFQASNFLNPPGSYLDAS